MLPLKQEYLKASPINDEETRNNREDEMETRILPPLEQESAKDSHINDEETRKNIVEKIIEE